MKKLKPCPFCGNDEAFIAKEDDGYYPTCGECPCSLLNLYDSEAEAREAWNVRADK